MSRETPQFWEHRYSLSSRTEVLRFSTVDMWDQLILVVRGCPVLSGTFRGLSGLGPLDASCTPRLVTTRSGSRYFSMFP